MGWVVALDDARIGLEALAEAGTPLLVAAALHLDRRGGPEAAGVGGEHVAFSGQEGDGAGVAVEVEEQRGRVRAIVV